MKSNAISIFPNPTNGVLSLKGEDLEDATITMTDMLCAVVLFGTLAGGQVDVSGLAAGVYMVALTADGKVTMEHIVKE